MGKNLWQLCSNPFSNADSNCPGKHAIVELELRVDIKSSPVPTTTTTTIMSTSVSTSQTSSSSVPASSRSKKGVSRSALGVLPANVALKSVGGKTTATAPFKVFEDAKKGGSRRKPLVQRSDVGVQCGGWVGVSGAETQTELSLILADPQARAESHMYSVDYKALAESRRKSLDAALQENEELKNQRVELVMENEDLKSKVADLEVDVSSLRDTLNEQSEVVKNAQEVLAIIGRAVD